MTTARACAIGGATAEIIAEGMRGEVEQRMPKRFEREDQGKNPQQLEDLTRTIIDEELTHVRASAQLWGVAAAELVGGDIHAAYNAAGNTVENNNRKWKTT